MAPWKVELGCDVVPTTLEWLWPRFLPRGKLVLLDGDPGMGKSLLTIDLLARLSSCGMMPDASSAVEGCTTVLLSAEDDAADTIRPRAEAAGADLRRLVLPNFEGRLPRLPEDIPALEELIRERRASLVVIDPLMAFLPPSVAANLDQCVRQALTPLAAVAARTGCSILLVRHLTKAERGRAIHRGQGSMGIMAAVRTAWFVAAHPKDPTGRVLAVEKNNLGECPPAQGYRVVASPASVPVIEWTGPVDLTADDLCKDDPASGVPAKDRAIDWLRQELSNGPRRSADLFAAAAEAGIPERTLIRAKQELGAHSHQKYDHKENRGEWYWYDSTVAWPKSAPFKRPMELPPLPELGEL